MILLLNDVDPGLVLVHGVQNDLPERGTRHCPERRVNNTLEGYKTIEGKGGKRGDLSNAARAVSEI